MPKKYKENQRVVITGTDYNGSHGVILEIDNDVITDPTDPNFDIDDGEYLVLMDKWITPFWFWESELNENPNTKFKLIRNSYSL